MCGGSPLDMQFDKNVNIYHAIACQAISTETLGTHEYNNRTRERI